MRPEILFPYFTSVKTLSGVGPKVYERLEKLGCTRVLDLIFHRPVSYIDRKHTPRIDEAEHGKVATFKVKILQHIYPARANLPHRVICENSTGLLELVFFNYKADYFAQLMPEGEIRLVSGTVEVYGDKRQMPHPDYILPESKKADILLLEPQYPLTFGISHKVLRKMIMQGISKLNPLPEWRLPARISFLDAIKKLHSPEDLNDFTPINRLAADELLAGQLAKAMVYSTPMFFIVAISS